MSDLKKLIDDTKDIRRLAESGKLQFPVPSLINLCERWLALMDEAGKRKPEWDLGAVGGQSSDCKPEAPKPHYEQKPAWEPGTEASPSGANETGDLARTIASALFTSGEKRYSHLSLNDKDELGWCENAVAGRIQSFLQKAHQAVETSERPDPFTGPHWPPMERRARKTEGVAQCLIDLRDELRRMREGK